MRGLNNGKYGPSFNHTLVTGRSYKELSPHSNFSNKLSVPIGNGVYENFESLFNRRQRIVE